VVVASTLVLPAFGGLPLFVLIVAAAEVEAFEVLEDDDDLDVTEVDKVEL
jgi:hypothetical protein